MKRNCQILRSEVVAEQLEREKEIIAKWREPRNVHKNIIDVQGMGTFYKDTCKKINGLITDDELTDGDHPLTENVSMDDSYQLKGKSGKSPTTDKIMKMLDKKYGFLRFY